MNDEIFVTGCGICRFGRVKELIGAGHQVLALARDIAEVIGRGLKGSALRALLHVGGISVHTRVVGVADFSGVNPWSETVL